jgi:CheY-like chemotaxis protein
MNILLVEDDDLDELDTRRTLDKMQIFYRLHVAKNGQDAIDFLEDDSHFVPDVALIDVSMPKMDGLEFLSWIRQQEKWKTLKCFILTPTDEPSERSVANNLGISGYIVKPLRMNNTATIDAFNLMIDLMNLSSNYSR